MHVPEDHIIRLHDAAATRKAIVSQFQSHLIRNPEIKQGDAILFYYSGHGSYVTPPSGWTIVKGAGDQSDDKVEVILPHDEGVTDPETGLPAYAIPDRTLAALIDSAAARHGDNITVILDCCSSGHGTRADTHILFEGERLVCRSVDEEHLTPLPPDLDHDLVSHISAQGISAYGTGRRGRLRALGTNHVLLAACRAREQARATPVTGGFLTNFWLGFMRGDTRPKTYAMAIKYINERLEEFWDSIKFRWDQHPQCEGIVRERIVFEETMIKDDHFLARKVETLGSTEVVFEVEAGEIYGVQEKTEFEIYGLDGGLIATKLGTGAATRVDGKECHGSTAPTGRPGRLCCVQRNYRSGAHAELYDRPQNLFPQLRHESYSRNTVKHSGRRASGTHQQSR